MNRRELLKLGLSSGLLALAKPKSAQAQERRCRVVVFGADALRYDYAWQLRLTENGGLSTLQPPVLNLSGGGNSETQPGWADIWTGLPAGWHGFVRNTQRNTLPDSIHIMGKLMDEFIEHDFYAVWITGKGVGLLDGMDPLSPHYPVYKRIVLEGRPGVYLGDENRRNPDVASAASTALANAIQHQNYCCFIHFRDPDVTGHATGNSSSYEEAARRVDQYVLGLMQQLPTGVDIIYCSDHGFNFVDQGAVESAHKFAPKGMIATSFTTRHKTICRPTVGRWIYSRSGGNPDYCTATEGIPSPYAMYGVDI